MKMHRSSMFALACALAATTLGEGAAAQDAQDTTSTQASTRQRPTAGINEIIVTAQKRTENVQDVPIAISAFGSEALKERAIGDVSQLSGITPNVTLDASTPFSGSSAVLGATIRGIGSNDFAFNIDPAVGVYLDGVYLGRSVGANQDLLDVERIEVLKGPQGTLFGRNTIGGAISIVTQTPGPDFAVKGDVTTGSYERFQVRGLVNIPITDGLSSSVAFGMHKRKGYQKRIAYPGDTGANDPFTAFPAAGYKINGDRQGGDDNWNVRGKLHWDDGGAFRATFTADHTNIDAEATPNVVLAVTPVSGPFGGLAENNIPGTALDVVTGNSGFLFAGLYNFCIGATADEIAARNAQNLCGPRNSVNGYNTLAGLASRNVDGDPTNDLLPYDDRWVTGDIDESYATGNNFSRIKQTGVALDLEYDVADTVTLKSISAFRKVDFSAGMDLDNSPLPILHTSIVVDQHQFSQEFQVTGSALDDDLNFAVGVYYFREAGDLHDYVTFSGGLLQVDGPGRIETDAYAGYGQVDWRMSDLIGFTFGARYTTEKKHYYGAQADVNGFNYKLFNCTPPGAACAAELGFPVPDEPFRYYPEKPDSQSFDNFSFKAGIDVHPMDDVMIYGSFAQGYKTGGWTTRLSNPLPVAPTFGEEMAETWELGFKTTLLDRILQLNGAVFTTKYEGIQLNFQEALSPVVRNAGDARIKGFELEMQAAPSGYFSVTASVGYLDAYYTNVDAAAQVPASALQAGVFAGSDLPKSPTWKMNVSPRLEIPVGEGDIVAIADWTHTTSMRNDTEGTFMLARPIVDTINASVTYNPPGRAWNLTVGGTNITDQRYIVTGQAQVAGGQVYGTYNRPAEWYARIGFEF